MQNTTNFNLKKPEGTDIYNIQNENDNMDIIDAALEKAHSTDDSASTDLVDGDYIPFYDVSATAKKKALWSTIIAKLKNIFPMGSTLAPIANGPKYPGTWSAGKQFVYQGLLYKTKVNVTSSDNINVGTGGNAELASDVTSQISNLNDELATESTSIAHNHSTSPIILRKKGSFREYIFEGRLNKNTSVKYNADTSYDIGTTPSDYRPLTNVGLYIPLCSDTICYLSINASTGVISIRPTTEIVNDRQMIFYVCVFT